jgi:hypothetical protein
MRFFASLRMTEVRDFVVILSGGCRSEESHSTADRGSTIGGTSH